MTGPATGTAASSTGGDSRWYKDAVIYEVHVRAFRDSNGDGIGDFRGLTEKLDYLADLGITALWILPFYPSPLRDDGYDIADFTGVHPDYGTLRDVRTLIREAHRRGLKVITELVCNHTSDQHAWFQRARRAKPGSAFRDFYVWSDSHDRYPDARIIFKDFERSNWTWDSVAGAYYWHRFYSHQPDLNFDNPLVHRAVFAAMDFWFRMGVDGLRLDAIPYLYERNGTNCENLPETHGFLKALRQRVDERYGDRMLLAEANQWPEDAAAYFGDGDECHMAFHFPVMPRLFMAIRQEDRFPVLDILAQTPAIPESAQWAMFLRNHDELTLEMVTDEERDYMYRVYAQDPQARINLGIRRRLAPLLGNNRRRIELMNALLFSLPGTPVIYYGDEIGMGDNIFVGDRNGVRTPMQWSGDRNAGFSSANRQQLYLPVIVDPEYHYEALNVETQQASPYSLLAWMRRLIALRRRYQAFGRGGIEFLHPENRRVLAFVRQYGEETILVVANLSRYVQPFELDLSAHEGQVPIELFGRVEFPAIGRNPYFMTLGPHSFLWLQLTTPAGQAEAVVEAVVPRLPPVADLGTLARGPNATRLADVISGWIQHRRWYRGKARQPLSTRITDAIPVEVGEASALFVIIDFKYRDQEPDTYAVPLMRMSGAALDVIADHASAVVAELAAPDEEGGALLVDAMRVPAFSEALLDVIAGRRRLRGNSGELVGRATKAFGALRGPASDFLAANPLRVEQSNSSVALGDRLMLKVYRCLEHGPNPDLELGRLLTERRYPNAPATAGWLEYVQANGTRSGAGILQAFVSEARDVWELTLDELTTFLEEVDTAAEPPPAHRLASADLLAAAGSDPTDEMAPIGAYLDTAELIGTRLGELHRTLGEPSDDPDIAPEPFSALYQRSLYQSIHGTTRGTLRMLETERGRLPDEARVLADEILGRVDDIDRVARGFLGPPIDGLRTRIHGDFHAGQLLHTGRDVVILDFEGEPIRPIGERRLKRTPLTDVAGMLRSFDYSAATAVQRVVAGGADSRGIEWLDAWARWWTWGVSAAFLRGYRAATSGGAFVPSDVAAWAVLLDALRLQKAFYEVGYEANNRPDWITVPLLGIKQLLDG